VTVDVRAEQVLDPQPGRTAGAPPRPAARMRRRLADTGRGYLFLAVAILCFGVFSWWPLVRGIILAFQQDNFVTPPYWVGLDNFKAVLDDPLFLTAWKNTVEFTGLALIFGYAVPFVVALVLNELRHLRGFFRIAVYLPVILPPIVTVLLWQFLYDPGNGLFNQMLGSVGLPTSQWLQSPKMVMLSLVLVSTWANMGGATILYLAGLSSIPGELYEAAELDGAGVWRRIWHVTLPQMRFLMVVLLLLQVIATMQVFIEPYQLTGTSDPNTITILVLIYRYAFSVNEDFGMAAAMSVLLFVVLAAFSAIYLRLTRSAD
jgi:multiple sugar transport system permease protein